MAVPAYAQDASVPSPGQAPANLAYVEGGVDLVHEGVTELADAPMVLLEGDVVRTRNGRAEMVFADGSVLHLDAAAEVEIVAPTRLRLLQGRVLVRVSAAATGPYVVDTPTASVRLDPRGEYGVVAEQGRASLEVSVARGVAEIDDHAQRIVARAGEMVSLAAAGARPDVQSFNSARWDSFAQWSNERINGFSASPSASLLPYELRAYAPMLEQYGRWDTVAPYGNVWFPAVSAGWRPYYEGSWGHTRYGWTWHGRDRWAWPTHHYGRWGYNGSFWFWIPARGWAPAWVTWGFAPGYVSWSPLGWDGHPVIGFSARRDHPAYLPHHDPWRGWTVVPRHVFGPRRHVRTHAVDGHRLDDITRRAMVLQNAAPPGPSGLAIPRGVASTPGARGNVRGVYVPADRPGNVRRPAPYEVSPGIEAFAQPSRPRRATDAPEYTPLPPVQEVGPGTSGNRRGSDERRPGSTRYPYGYVSPSTRPDRPDATPPPQTGAQPRGGERAAPQSSNTDRGSRGSREGAASPPAGDSSTRPGNVRAAPRGGQSEGRPAGASESGGARQRGGASGAPAPGRPASGSEGGAVRRPPA